MEIVPTLPENKNSSTTLSPADELIQPRTVEAKYHEKITIKGATTVEVLQVENLVHGCAKDGDGFNLDEFCPNYGHFLHKFLHEPKVVIATDDHGNIKGAAICGFSALTRIPGSLYSAYFAVKRTDKRKGIATALLDVVCEMSRKQQCNLLLFDVFANNQVAIDWLHKQGFIVTGSIPKCGYIANKGFTDSLFMYKELNEITSRA